MEESMLAVQNVLQYANWAHISDTHFHWFMPCWYDTAAHIITLPLWEHTGAKFVVKLDIAMLSFSMYLGGTLSPVKLLVTELGCPLPHSQFLEEKSLNNMLLKRQHLEQAAA